MHDEIQKDSIQETKLRIEGVYMFGWDTQSQMEKK